MYWNTPLHVEQNESRQMRLSKPRFALKSLFVLTALIGCLLAYPVLWIHKRHQLLQDYSEAIEGYRAQVVGHPSQLYESRRTTTGAAKSLPWFLQLFGEPSHDHVVIVRQLDTEQFEETHVPQDQWQNLLLHQELDRLYEIEIPIARKYFPEAHIDLSVYAAIDIPIPSHFNGRNGK
jgi:hypothetical protein